MCDYPKARRVWESLVKVGERGYFYHHNWYAWLISNISLSNKDSHDVDWPLKFGIVPWFIWKDRCQRVFDVKQVNWYDIVLAIKRMVVDVKMF